MKKIVFTAALFALAGTAAIAQGISVGPRIGVNFANQTASGGAPAQDDFPSEADFHNDTNAARTGFVIGAVLNIGVTEAFSIQPEILYSQQGFKSDFNLQIEELEVKGKQTFTANYLQVPVLAKYAFGSDDMKFFLNAGPYLGYWMSGNSKQEGTASFAGNTDTPAFEIPFDEEMDVEFDKPKDLENFGYEFNRLDAGLTFGAGIGFNTGPGMLTLDARYNLGLSNTLKPAPEDEDFKLANRVFGISVGYLFSLGQ